MIAAKVIRAYRESKGISVRAMAKIIGVEHTALWRFEQGRQINTPSWVAIIKWLLTATE